LFLRYMLQICTPATQKVAGGTRIYIKDARQDPAPGFLSLRHT